MITFGLTGGIASGKSTITKTFRRYDIPMVDADIVAREVVMPGTKGLQLIIDTFGKEFLLQDGTLNRPMLGEIVFKDKDKRNIINDIMLPLIREESVRQINSLHQQDIHIVGYDAALIIEMGAAKLYNPLIVVHCKPELQLERLMKRNELTKEQAMNRIEAQLPVAHKLKLAHYAIDTSGTIDESIAQTENIIRKLKSQL